MAAPGASPTVVSLSLQAAGRIFTVRATIAGGPRLARLVVDTGAGTSALSVDCARRFDLELEQGLDVQTPTGLSRVGTVQVSALRVGPFEVAPFRFAVVPLPDGRVDGLLGLDFFRAIGGRALTLHLPTSTHGPGHARLDVTLGRALLGPRAPE